MSERRGGEGGAGVLPEAAVRVAGWCVVVLLVTGVAWVTVWLCVLFKAAVIPVLLALLGTALLTPLHRRLLAMRVQRSLAAGLTCAAVLVVVGGATYIVVVALVDSGDQIVASAKQAAQDVAGFFGAAGTTLDDLASNARGLFGQFGGTAASGVISGLSVVAQGAAMAVLAVLLVFFFVRDGDRVAVSLRTMAPGPVGEMTEAIGRRAYRAVEGFMRGTTLIALIDGVLTTVGLLILGVPGAAGLGALVFIGAYIPYLGAFVSGVLAVLVALADRGFAIALWTLLVIFLVQVLEANVLQPVIQSRTVQMHPAVVLVAITAGATVGGIIGVLLAVPATAAAFGIVAELRERYAGGGGATAAPAGPPGEPAP
ncbi:MULTISPECIES: AI-2E family transporter [Streptomyces]|uniref:AI-2E family transporter n=1 Tax=Streptomyces TaxID=1883 RepID=UPI0013DE6C6A|nr:MULTISPECIES: AI-2E family transporter [Streptomyces]MDQ0294670.1 putative PurR-regulated permease PerM [Streptomyces sp. DSM 41037]WPR52020.1 AI-2E family transporter [Streptomyces sp. S399]WSU36883.1 AI-2E family transporter [Streptomyces gougerotii]GGU16654.1 AI-2E family transporter [Streptomyces diastaticus subsp. diastaticus]